MRRRRIGDLIELQRRKVDVDPLEIYEEIGIRSFGRGIFHKEPVDGAALGNKRVFSVQPGDLVFNNVFAWEGAVALAGPAEVGRCGSHRFMTYTAKTDDVDLRYLHRFFLSEPGLVALGAASPGSAGRNRTLAIDRFENLEVPVPDIAEQRSLVERLDALSDRVQVLVDAIARAKRGIAALPEALASGLIRAVSCPEEPLGRHATVMRGKGPQYDPESGHAVVNQACVRWGGLDLSRVKYASSAWIDALPPLFRISTNDVLVNSTGEGTIGRACVASGQAVGLPFDSHVLVARTNHDDLDPAYLALFLQSADGQAAINNAKSATTTKQTELGKAKLEDLLVPLPDIERQRATVSRARTVLGFTEEVAQRRDTAARKTSALWAATLNRAFTGVT